MDTSEEADRFVTAITQLNNLREDLEKKSMNVLEENKLLVLLNSINEDAPKRSHDDPQLTRFIDAIWGLTLAIILGCPSNFSWSLAMCLSTSLFCIKHNLQNSQPLLGVETVRKATTAWKSQPLIPKAFANLLIAMVTQRYITVDDLENHTLTLLHVNWLKEELEFVQKCLLEVRSLFIEKVVREPEVLLTIDWMAETTREMISDMEP